MHQEATGAAPFGVGIAGPEELVRACKQKRLSLDATVVSSAERPFAIGK